MAEAKQHTGQRFASHAKRLLEELAVLTTSPRCAAQLGAEFPSIHVRYEKWSAADCNDGKTDRQDCLSSTLLRGSEWERSDFDTWAFDVAIDELARAPFTLRLADDTARDGFPLEVLNRCQRHIDRRNRHSHGQLFTRVLRKHRALHDLQKPLVRADYNHALDVWQWLLRLDGEAPAAVQLAALFHDIERLASESDARVEHLAADYQAFKDAHANKGAEMTLALLAEAGVGESVRERVAQLVARHERQSDDPEIALLNDVDALSFFSLNSPGYAHYFGPEQTRKKVAYTWNRMREGARRKLACVRLTTEIRTTLNEVAAAS